MQFVSVYQTALMWGLKAHKPPGLALLSTSTLTYSYSDCVCLLPCITVIHATTFAVAGEEEEEEGEEHTSASSFRRQRSSRNTSEMAGGGERGLGGA